MTTLKEALDMGEQEYAKFEQEARQFWGDTKFGIGLQPTAFTGQKVSKEQENLKCTPNEQPDQFYDSIENPSHYTEGRQIEPIEAIVDWNLDFCLGNVVKYISRAGRKDKTKELEDLKKAIILPRVCHK